MQRRLLAAIQSEGRTNSDRLSVAAFICNRPVTATVNGDRGGLGGTRGVESKAMPVGARKSDRRHQRRKRRSYRLTRGAPTRSSRRKRSITAHGRGLISQALGVGDSTVMLFVAVIVLISVTMIVSMPALLGVAQLQQPFAWVVGEGVHSSGVDADHRR